MGTSTNAILAYGFNLGEGNLIRETGEYGEVNLPWLSDDDGLFEAMQQRLLAEMAGFTETWETRVGDGYFKREEEAKARLGVQIVHHCSDSCPMIVLAVAETTAHRGEPVPLDLAAYSQEPAANGWDERLARAVEVLGMTPLQPRPQWLLCSWWG